MHPHRPTRRSLASRAVATAAALASTALLGPSAHGAEAGDPAPVPFDVPTHLRVSTFNLLGYGHTVPGGDHHGYADGVTRMNRAVRVIRDNGLQVIGFQEMQKPQYQRFMELEGDAYDIYPGNQITTAAMANSIAWRTSQWRLLDAETIQIPYFHGNLIRMPYVLLQNTVTGREVWVYNSHNPANAHGPAQRFRDEAVRREAALFNRLQADYPTIPIISTGDENDRERYFCQMVETTQMRAANGGGLQGGRCVTPTQMHVDWVMGSPLVDFTAHVALRNALVKKTTDHFVVYADAVLPSEAVVTSGITRVVLVSIDGLGSGSLHPSLAAGTAPHLQSMIDRGATTMNARTELENTSRIPTLTGMLTGRPVNPAIGGTGIGWPGSPRGATVSATAGRYISSMFDIVHNYGRSTALYSSRPDTGRLATSWNATNGGRDPYGLDNGRNKIDTYVRTARDADTVDSVTSRLDARPARLTVVQLAEPNHAGQKWGFHSAEYAAAVASTDRLVGRIQATIAHSRQLNGHTLLVVTANRGGTRHAGDPSTIPSVYRVPLLVTGPGVPAGADLYAMNPRYVDPGSTNPGYTTGSPIRNTLVANLATKMLGWPGIPGSRFDRGQYFTVLAPPATP